MRDVTYTVSILGLLVVMCQSAQAQSVSVDPDLFSKGTELYSDHCAICHGVDGDGKGPLASGFAPRPRDFTLSSFKFRSTEFGEYPTKADLLKTLRRGINGPLGQTMPSFDFLSDQDLQALVEVVRFAAGIEDYGTPVSPPPRPAEVNLARGEFLFEDLNCSGCHGATGDGQGVLAEDLFDGDNLPIQPADLRARQFKGGNDPEDIWMRIYTGLDGTPMPAFGRNTSAADIWAVTEYVITFSE